MYCSVKLNVSIIVTLACSLFCLPSSVHCLILDHGSGCSWQDPSCYQPIRGMSMWRSIVHLGDCISSVLNLSLVWLTSCSYRCLMIHQETALLRTRMCQVAFWWPLCLYSLILYLNSFNIYFVIYYVYLFVYLLVTFLCYLFSFIFVYHRTPKIKPWATILSHTEHDGLDTFRDA